MCQATSLVREENEVSLVPIEPTLCVRSVAFFSELSQAILSIVCQDSRLPVSVRVESITGICLSLSLFLPCLFDSGIFGLCHL